MDILINLPLLLLSGGPNQMTDLWIAQFVINIAIEQDDKVVVCRELKSDNLRNGRNDAAVAAELGDLALDVPKGPRQIEIPREDQLWRLDDFLIANFCGVLFDHLSPVMQYPFIFASVVQSVALCDFGALRRFMTAQNTLQVPNVRHAAIVIHDQ